MVTTAQIKAARALVGWGQLDLAKAAGLSASAVKNIERGSTPGKLSSLNAIQFALTEAGVRFLSEGETSDGGAGVRLRA